VFAILIANGQLITLVRLKKCFLHPVDLHMIFNLITASDSFKYAETWTPVCLPKFDSRSLLSPLSYLYHILWGIVYSVCLSSLLTKLL